MACNKQLVPCDTTAMSANHELVSWAPTSQPRIRTNIVLLKPLSFYIPDDDDSVPYAFMLGRHTISTAGGGCEEALLSGYFSALCAVLPDLTNIAKKVMTNLGFQVEEIAVPSQADRMNIVIPQSQNLKHEIIQFAQMCLLPFQIRFDSDINIFWREVAKDAGVVVADDSSLMMCSVDGMETLNTALVVSRLNGELRSSMASEDDESVPFASVLGRHAISDAKGHEQALLSGHFSALCEVLQDLVRCHKENHMQILRYKVEDITIPSQAARMNKEIPHQSPERKLEILMFAQMCYFSFANKFDTTLASFWKKVSQ